MERRKNASSLGKSGRGEAGRCIARTSLYKYVSSLSRLYIFIVAAIDDTVSLSIAELKMRARHFKHKKGLGLIVIDYLQLIRSSSYTNNRVQEVSEVSRELKNLARELNVPVLALSQLSRNLEMRADKRPQLSDLRESGSIEQDADMVMFLYRDEYYNRDTDDQNIAELMIAKNRNGATGFKRFIFDAQIVQFRDFTKRES